MNFKNFQLYNSLSYMPIYTRTGDDGTTALFGGKRVLKCEELVDVYGSIDELNSWMGLVVSKVESPFGKAQDKQKLKVFLEQVQGDLFTIGSTLAGWEEIAQGRALKNWVVEMEKQIDEWEKELPPLNNFILPGGCELASHIHVARAICRRVERQMVGYFKGPAFEAHQGRALVMYLNRLSDLLFTLARTINKDANVEEVVWSGNPRLKK